MLLDNLFKNFIYDPVSVLGLIVFYFLLLNLPISLFAVFKKQSSLTVGRKGPKYLLLDEPFAGIDPLAVNDLKKLILKLSGNGVGILITDHNVRETLLITNKSYVLSEGKILAYGSSSELADNPIVKKYYLGDNFRL